MAKSPTPFLGIELPVPGSAEPFRVADYNAAFTTVDDWAEALESGIASGAKPVAASALTGAVPVEHGGTGGTTVVTAREGLRIFVQSSQPSSPTAGDIWFW
jgi:hypothetical protein